MDRAKRRAIAAARSESKRRMKRYLRKSKPTSSKPGKPTKRSASKKPSPKRIVHAVPWRTRSPRKTKVVPRRPSDLFWYNDPAYRGWEEEEEEALRA